MITVEQVMEFMVKSPYKCHDRFPSAVRESCEWAQPRNVESIKRVVEKVIKTIQDSDPSFCPLPRSEKLHFNSGTFGSHRGSGVMYSSICYNGRME